MSRVTEPVAHADDRSSWLPVRTCSSLAIFTISLNGSCENVRFTFASTVFDFTLSSVAAADSNVVWHEVGPGSHINSVAFIAGFVNLQHRQPPQSTLHDGTGKQ